jgi:DNA-binding NtrC family response regulator
MLKEQLKILVIDDDSSIRNMLAIVLKKQNFEVMTAENGKTALDKLKKNQFNLIISDIKMPDITGIELLKKIKVLNEQIPVIMITAYASTQDAIEAMKLGAEDYITKPFNLDELKIVIDRALHRQHIEYENVELKAKLLDLQKFEDIIGSDPRMLKIFSLINSIANTDSTVLITGESGTGKELIAKAVHRHSNRRSCPFVSINCGALPENLLESELFGHCKGSFTDAHKDKTGLLEMADKGTVFLDEISEMSTNMQVKLLRALQERVIRRVGGNQEIAIDVRIISATNKDLQQSIAQKEFRSDLYYRLNVISMDIPPLRERKEDIPLLMQHFLNIFTKKFDKPIRGYHKDVIELFLGYHWPGNIRELENFVERAVALEKNEFIGVESIPTDIIYSLPESSMPEDSWQSRLLAGDFNFSDYIDGVSIKIVAKALQINNNNLKKTADSLQLNYRSMRYLIEKYNIKLK